MIDYIIEILENNNRLIIPEFGAFIVKQRNPLLITFNEFLQYNDGVLVETISRKENVQVDVAKARVDKFITEINTILNQGEYYALDQLGDLVKNPSGKIILCEPNAVFEKSTFYHDNEIPIEIEDTNTAEPEDKVIEPESIVESEPQSENVFTEKENADTEKTDKKEISENFEKVVEEEKPNIVTKEQPEIKAEKEAEPIVEIPRPYIITPEAKVNHQPSTTRTKTVIVWTIIILLVNAIIAGIFLRNHIFNQFKKNVEVVQPIIAADTVKQQENTLSSTLDSTIKEVITSELAQKKEVPVKQNLNGDRYYIVAGVFRNEANANNLIDNLKKKGFNPEKFEKGELFGVSYESYTSKDEAEKALIRIKSETDAGAWLKTINY
jgi:nucleoid DNA-binding protein